MNFARFKHFSAKTKEKGTARDELAETAMDSRMLHAGNIYTRREMGQGPVGVESGEKEQINIG
jgi:hypothetical protein